MADFFIAALTRVLKLDALNFSLALALLLELLAAELDLIASLLLGNAGLFGLKPFLLLGLASRFREVFLARSGRAVELLV